MFPNHEEALMMQLVAWSWDIRSCAHGAMGSLPGPHVPCIGGPVQAKDAEEEAAPQVEPKKER